MPIRDREGRDRPGPLTARDIIAVEALKLAIGPAAAAHRTQPAELVKWSFEVADEFVKLSTSHWAESERAEAEKKESDPLT